MRKTTGFASICLLASLLFGASTAHAESLEQGSFSLGVERLYGLTYTKQNSRAPGGNVKTSTLNYSFLSNPGASQRTVYSAPRLAADYLITDQWSAGLGFGVVGGSTTLSSDAGEQDGPNIFSLLFAPRAGFLVAQTSWFAFWPKAGFTYTRAVAKTGSADVGQYRGALSVEAGVLILPGKNISLGFTPTFDWGLLGSNSAGGESIRTTAWEAGLQGSLGVYF